MDGLSTRCTRTDQTAFSIVTSANLEVPELGGRSKVIYMMLVQKNTLSHCILVFMYSETCLIRTLCSKVTAGPTCGSSNVLPRGCDEFSGPQILYYLKM